MKKIKFSSNLLTISGSEMKGSEDGRRYNVPEPHSTAIFSEIAKILPMLNFLIL